MTKNLDGLSLLSNDLSWTETLRIWSLYRKKSKLSTYCGESNLGESDWLCRLLFRLWCVIFFEFVVLFVNIGVRTFVVCDLWLWEWNASSLSTSYSLKVVVLPSWFWNIERKKWQMDVKKNKIMIDNKQKSQAALLSPLLVED
jgi:hypothetical protein